MSDAIPAARRPGTLRARVRAEMLAEIKQVALRHLETEGGDLSLRAVARELGMVSSAIYRYFASRDELLTALIIDAYVAVAEHASHAVETAGPKRAAQFTAMATAIRDWARERPAEYALIYGSPVAGYTAPTDTIAAAAELPGVLGGILREAAEDGTYDGRARGGHPRRPAGLRADLAAVVGLEIFAGVPAEVMMTALGVWGQLLGLISLELFGHFVGVIEHGDEFFAAQVRDLSDRLSL